MTETPNTEATENQELQTDNAKQQDTSWRDQITDDEVRNSKSMANFKDLNGLAKSYVSLEKKLGTPKEPETFNSEDYQIDFGEGYKPNEEVFNSVQKKAEELGINPNNFKELAKVFSSTENAIIQKMEKDNKAQEKEFEDSIKKEWGNDYEDRLKGSREVLTQYLNEDQKTALLNNLNSKQALSLSVLLDSVKTKISEPVVEKTKNVDNESKEVIMSKIKNAIIENDNAEISKLWEKYYQ